MAWSLESEPIAQERMRGVPADQAYAAALERLPPTGTVGSERCDPRIEAALLIGYRRMSKEIRSVVHLRNRLLVADWT